MGTMITGLGGTDDYGENSYRVAQSSGDPNFSGGLDDGTVAVDISSVFGSGIDFFGTNYSSIFINSNGNISFTNTSTNNFESSDLSAETTPTIAPFWADVNINNGGEIYWDLDPTAGTVTVTWLNVAPFSGSGAGITNSFQVVLTSTGGGDFTVDFIYEDINWTDGNNENAQVGLTDGGANDVIVPGSGDPVALADYVNNADTTDFTFVGGVPQGIVGGTSGDDIIGTGFVDTEGDAIDGADGLNDIVDAGDGDDFIDAGAGNDTITGGGGDDTFVYEAGDGLDEITDFNAGNSGSINDGDQSNNDFLDLSDFYDDITEVREDFNDDGVLNQSNATTNGGTVDYTDNTLINAGEGIELTGVTASDLTFDNTNVQVDTDGDGVFDADDLDDDNDGILDTEEGQASVVNDVNQDFSAATATTTNFTIDSGNTGVTIDIYTLDNSFSLAINGTSITTSEIEFQAAGTSGQTIQFTDGTNYESGGIPSVWQLTGTVDDPLIRVIIDADGDVQIFGAKSSGGPLEEMELIGGNAFQSFSWNAGSSNSIAISQSQTGPTNIDGTVFGTTESTVAVDTDGDGIFDHLDLDSDNDGISDLVESGQDASVVDTNNDGVHDGAVNTQGVPTAANGGNGVDPVDSDGDGIDDFRDLDSDGDGISDFIEAQPTGGYQAGDGDLTNDDADGDGIVDLFDSNDGTTGDFGGSFTTPVNTDAGNFNSDSVADYLDDDSDGDGVLDSAESGLGTPGADNNGDGIGDNITDVSYADPGGATDGTDLANSNLLNVDNNADEPDFRSICFARGTLIKTDKGQIAVEDLGVGDHVFTMDCGYQPINWIGSMTLDVIDLAQHPKLRPIRIRKDALGPGYPEQDLIVSPQHRILVRSRIAHRMFDTDEVLIPANKLLSLDGVTVEEDTSQGVEYFHMLFDSHQIVFSNGAPSESLFTGPEALKAVSPAARAEIEMLFPAITAPDFQARPVRPIPEKGKHMKKLVQRHYVNDKPIYAAH